MTGCAILRTMRNAQLLAVLACVLPMTGCITLSLYPLYTAKDVVTDLPLEGKWMDSDKKEVWEIRRAGDAYVATDPTDEKSEPIEVRLVRLGERHFLDFTSNQTPSLAIAAHLFSKVWMTGDELHVQTVDDDWLAKKARDSGLAFAEDDDADTLGAPFNRDRLRGVRVKLDGDIADSWRGINQANLTLSQGFLGLGSTDNGNPLASRLVGRVDFTKLEASLSRTQPLFDRFSAYGSLYGQYGLTPLLTPEQCGYGGRYFGRAYDPSEIIGDSCFEALG